MGTCKHSGNSSQDKTVHIGDLAIMDGSHATELLTWEDEYGRTIHSHHAEVNPPSKLKQWQEANVTFKERHTWQKPFFSGRFFAPNQGNLPADVMGETELKGMLRGKTATERVQVELGSISVVTEIYSSGKVVEQYLSREHKKQLLEPLTDAVIAYFESN